MRRAQVIISGAWPAGFIAAYRLMKLGVDVLLLESTPDPGGPMRASTFNPATLDMMEDLGWLEELEAQGLRAPVYQHRNLLSGEVLSLDFGEVSDELRHPYRLHCDQDRLIRLAIRKLTGHPNSDVRFQHRLVGIEQDDRGVTAYAETIYGIEAFRGDYMLAAEGSIPVTHNTLDVQFNGLTWPQKFLTLSTTFSIEEHFSGLAYVNYVSEGEDWYVLLRTPSCWHILVPAGRDETDAYLLSDAKKESVMARLVGSGVDVPTERRAIVRINQRVADRYDHGRVLLMGDGAHQNIPLGGWGLNSGIHDAWNLTDKLDAIINRGCHATALFGRYDRQRRSIMQSFHEAEAIRSKKGATGPAVSARQRQWELAAMIQNDRRRRDYLLDQAMVKSLRQEAHIV